MMVAVVIPDPFQPGRWVLCRRNRLGWTTAISSHCDQQSAERERMRLQSQFDFEANRPPINPDQPRQLVMGFYSDDQP